MIDTSLQCPCHNRQMDGPLVNSGIPLATQTVVSPVTQIPSNLSSNKRKTPTFLSNLGKATLRGIRKCPQCGVYNGTRGLSCKNKACGTVFRGGVHGTGRLKKGKAEVVQVVMDGGGGRTGGTQVFSVRQRGRGSEQRGFVELVFTDTAITTADGTMLTRVSLGRCHMPSCQQNESESTIESVQHGVSQSPKSPCNHVKQAMECQTQATPLPLKSSVLESLVATAQAKEELWRLATETTGPLVQRVSKGTLIVKCQAGDAHPLGLLHLMVGSPAVKEKNQGSVPFRCGCHARCGKGRKEGENSYQHSLPERCLHFYACVCAFTSDEKLATEFSAFLNYNLNEVQERTDATALSISESQQHIEPSIHQRSKRLKLMESTIASSVSSSSPLAVKDPSVPTLIQRKPTYRKNSSSTGLKNPGTCSAEQTDPVPFVIEWIPDILPHSQVGELRIRFEYGHQLGGNPECNKSSAGTDRTKQTLADTNPNQ